MEGFLDQDFFPIHRFHFLVLELPPIDFQPIAVSGIAEKLHVEKMPDESWRSHGRSEVETFELTFNLADTAALIAFDIWWLDARATFSPFYKKTCSLRFLSSTGEDSHAFAMTGVMPIEKRLPAGELGNPGDMATITWVMQADTLFPF